MAITGINSAYGNVYESRYASSKKEVTGKHGAEQAVGLEQLPVSHQNMTASWKDLGVRAGSSAQDKKIEKKLRRKPKPQNYYEKRKYLRKLFEEKQVRKEQVRAQLEERLEEKEMYARLREKNALLRERNTNRAIDRYEASVLKW